ncbi:MAG TPA: metal ABC transporter permease [Pseudonocardia sp.]|nr:metal ABC transporter permease [Pseudonocardia sp.]
MTGNPIDDLRVVLSYHFMLNALRAGTIVAIVAGSIGYLMVQRRQSYAGHTLAVIGFPGAAGATWLGLNPAVGYFGFCLAGALVIAGLPGSGRVSGPGGVESAGIGTVQTFALACGLLFVSLYRGFQSGLNNLLFGAITGVSDVQVVVLLVAGVACVVVLVLLGRPLLFASVDPRVARASGVPVRWLNVVFLLLLGTATAGASQITGSLLVFALLVAPASAAIRLTARPSVGVALSVLIALVVTWAGEVVAFFSPYPIGFWVTTLGFAAFLLASGYRLLAERGGWRRAGPPVGVTS